MEERMLLQILEEMRSINRNVRALREELKSVREDNLIIADNTSAAKRICDAAEYMAAVIKKEYEEDKERDERQKKLDEMIEERRKYYESLEAKAAIDMM